MRRKLIRIIAIFTGFLGLVILLVTLVPILKYQIEARTKYPDLVSPLVDGAKEGFQKSLNTDYTKASNWFESSEAGIDFKKSNISFYKISVPKLKIENATVSIGGEDLAESLIQFPGTALPGKVGNTVIFGHSILPIFYNPKNYLAIFSTLPSLKEGNEIFVEYDGITYKYIVESKFEVSPKDIQILDQDSSNSYLTLVTCTPPGHPLKPKRLIIRAKIVPIAQVSI